MITTMLVLILSDVPFPMFGALRYFDTLKECRAYIAKEAPEQLKARMDCIQVVRADVKSA